MMLYETIVFLLCLQTVVDGENKHNKNLTVPNLISQDQIATNINNNNSNTAADTVTFSASLSDLNSIA